MFSFTVTLYFYLAPPTTVEDTLGLTEEEIQEAQQAIDNYYNEIERQIREYKAGMFRTYHHETKMLLFCWNTRNR